MCDSDAIKYWSGLSGLSELNSVVEWKVGCCLTLIGRGQ
jgi:hypothetical protein